MVRFVLSAMLLVGAGSATLAAPVTYEATFTATKFRTTSGDVAADFVPDFGGIVRYSLDVQVSRSNDALAVTRITLTPSRDLSAPVLLSYNAVGSGFRPEDTLTLDGSLVKDGSRAFEPDRFLLTISSFSTTPRFSQLVLLVSDSLGQQSYRSIVFQGASVQVVPDVQVVPEPASAALLAAMIPVLLLRRRSGAK